MTDLAVNAVLACVYFNESSNSHKQWRINHCAACTTGGGPLPPWGCCVAGEANGAEIMPRRNRWAATELPDLGRQTPPKKLLDSAPQRPIGWLHAGAVLCSWGRGNCSGNCSQTVLPPKCDTKLFDELKTSAYIAKKSDSSLQNMPKCVFGRSSRRGRELATIPDP